MPAAEEEDPEETPPEGDKAVDMGVVGDVTVGVVAVETTFDEQRVLGW